MTKNITFMNLNDRLSTILVFPSMNKKDTSTINYSLLNDLCAFKCWQNHIKLCACAIIRSKPSIKKITYFKLRTIYTKAYKLLYKTSKKGISYKQIKKIFLVWNIRCGWMKIFARNHIPPFLLPMQVKWKYDAATWQEDSK